ncbi:MAG: hypothetical protein C4344_02870, partial [Acidimicrobiia bacterium]
MRAQRSFTVRPVLPPALAPLMRLAMNLRWSWDERVRDLFRWVDPEGWEQTGHDPVRLLGRVPRERLDALCHDAAFMGLLDALATDLDHYLSTPGWFQDWQARTGIPLRAVAYFSPEFGIAEALPQYSGGLGVLAGDHLKAASALRVPLVGVGLFYRQGYFHQELDAEGWQRERYVDLDPYAMALTPVEGARVTVDLAGTPAVAQVWRAEVGRVRLYLLDTDVEDNDGDVRGVTDRLYGGDIEHRLRQEILLGIGGVRALDAVGEEVQVFHTNEGHAGFLGLERIRRAMLDDGLSLAEAVEAVRAATVFTTHTPVPAGIDRFPRHLMEKYFGRWCEEVGVGFDDLMELGHQPGEPPDEPFNMAVMGPPARPREPPDVQRAVVGAGRGRRPDHLGHQRRAPTHVGLTGDDRPARPLRAARVAGRRARPLGAHRRGPRGRDLAGPRAVPPASRRLRAPAAVRRRGRQSGSRRGHVLDRHGPRPPRA